MTSVKEQLKLMRLEPAAHHDPQKVLALSKPLIESGKVSSFGNDAWDVYEQAAIAALEVSDDELAMLCITRLSDKFPASGRVHALKGMLYECTRDPEETLKYYNKVLSVEPTNVPVIKRKATFLRSLDRPKEAVSVLVAYLDVYYSDADAWAELAEIYSSCHEYTKAAFCCAEVVLLKPEEHISHVCYADALLAQATVEESETLLHVALREYLRSIELCDDYIRGFCGARICCLRIKEKTPQRTGKQKSQKALVTRPEQGLEMDSKKVDAVDIMCVNVLKRLQTNIKSDADHDAICKYIDSIVSTQGAL